MIYLVDFPCVLIYNRRMVLSSGVKFRCYPDSYQARVLSAWIGCQRFIYNAKVAEERYFRRYQEKALALTGFPAPVDQQYSQFKDMDLTPFLFDVPSQILRNGATRFMGAYQRFRAGLALRPAFKKSCGRQSVWITGELFRFMPTGKAGRRGHKTIYGHALFIGTKKHGLGALKFKAHTEYGLPSTITVSRENGKWYVSFSYDKAGALMDQAELIDLYRGMSKDDLGQITIGLDRGVCIPAASSSGDIYNFKTVELERLARKERRQKRYQRQAARRKKGSRRRKRSLREKAKCSAYATNIRHDFAHQASRKIADSCAEIIVFEDLKVRNMTARPKPKKGRNGTYQPNGAKAKAGLNRAILDSAWGKIRVFTTYKANRLNKLVLAINPHGTSHECSRCGHTHPDNRLSQARFECISCGHMENADVNAARIIKARGISELTSGEFTIKNRKRAMRLRKKSVLGQGLPDVMRGEKNVRRDEAINLIPLSSVNRETPTTIAQAI